MTDHDKNPSGPAGNGLQVKAGKGGNGREGGGVRQKYGENHGRENP